MTEWVNLIQESVNKQTNCTASKMAGMGGTKRILSKYFVEIEKEIDLANVIPHLLSRKCFNYQDEREILSYQSHYDQVEAFVDILSSKGWEGFQHCCSVFETLHPNLLSTFLNELQGMFIYF